MSAGTTERTQRTVVGVDGSPGSLAALEWAASRAEATGSTVVAAASWTWPPGYGAAVLIPGDYDPAADAEALVQGAVADAHLRHPGVEFVPRVVEGRAADVLVEASRGPASERSAGSRAQNRGAGGRPGTATGVGASSPARHGWDTAGRGLRLVRGEQSVLLVPSRYLVSVHVMPDQLPAPVTVAVGEAGARAVALPRGRSAPAAV